MTEEPPRASPAAAVGVIGAGAMGMGVVASLLRAGHATHVRDVRAQAQDEAAARGAYLQPSPAALAAACEIAIVLVVDASQVEAVLFAADGVAAAPHADGRRIVMLASTLDPDYVAGLAPRLESAGIDLVDAPVSGGPARAHDGTMTMMVAGAPSPLAACEHVFAAVAGKVFRVGARPGDAARFKIVNNLLAAVNLAAGAEALALAVKAGLDPRQVVDVINASSGGSWIFADRMPRALAGDYVPRAAARVLRKDVGIAADFAARHGAPAPFALAALEAFEATVAAGLGEEDDAAIYKWSRMRAGLPDE